MTVTPLRDEPPINPPINTRLEQLLLGALLVDNSRLADVGNLKPEHLALETHQRLFEMISRIINQNLPATPKTLAYMLNGEAHLVASLSAAAVTSSPLAVNHWATELIELHYQRRLLALSQDLPEIFSKEEYSHTPRLEAVRAELDQIYRERDSDKPPQQLTSLDFETLAERPDIDRPWLVKDWFPILETIGVGGVGGEGKTLLSHQLATSAALGKPWLGMPVTQMKAALFLCEDRHDDSHWRQAVINRDLGCSMRDLAGKLKVYPRRDASANKLGTFDRNNVLQLTPLFFTLLGELREFGARLVILDTRSDIFLGEQFNEEHARTFVRQVCDRLARELHGLVLLLYQPSKAGMFDKTGMSGSVQWDAAFRARAMLRRPQATENHEPDPDARIVELVKSNFSASGAELEIRWQNGVFIRDVPEEKPAYQVSADNSAAERVWREHFAVLTERLHRVLSPQAAVKAVAKENRLSKRAVKCSERDLHNVMMKLVDQGEYRIEEYGIPSRRQVRIVKVDKPE